MNDTTTPAQTLAYLTILVGCLLAVVTAFEPQPTGAWRLAGTWLFCGLIPYVFYGSFITMLSGCSLLIIGTLLIVADVVARAAFGLTAATSPDPLAPIWLVTVLVLAVLPAGWLTGRLLGRLAVCRTGDNDKEP